MQTADRFDVSTLAWIKGELEATLKEARGALEAYAEQGYDVASLEACAEACHQVRGTLQMVELAAAERFVGEVEALLAALQQEQVDAAAREPAAEALMRAILQLPDYLEGLQRGRPDSLLPLLPLVNEMRDARGESALSPLSEFHPDLSAVPPRREGGGDARTVARKARPYYQTSLANLLRDHDTSASFNALSKVLDALLRASSELPVQQAFWIGAGLVEALQEGGIALSREIKQLLGQLEKLIKHVAQGGEAGLQVDSVQALSRLLLFQVAGSGAGGPLVAGIKDAFGLKSLFALPTAAGGELNAELKRTVAADVLEELANVKDTLDVFVRGARTDSNTLVSIMDGLRRLADTLDLLRQDELQQALVKQVEVLDRIRQGELQPDDPVLMGVAGALLLVESQLQDWGSDRPVEPGDTGAQGDEGGHDAEYQRVIRQVMKEVQEELVRIRGALTGFLEAPEDKQPLAALQGHFHRLVRSLELLSYSRVAKVLRASALFVRDELAHADRLPPPERLDRLAEAVMSVEYYLEAFARSRVHPGAVLDVAERALEALGYRLDSLPDVLEAEELTAPEPANLESQAATGVSGAAADDDEPEDEITQIFLEEAEEELGKLQELLPRWERDRDDEDALADYRRSFHTLKGSGRLVGAEPLGDFAWAMENLLNRVIDGSVTPDETLFELLHAAQGMLPGLVEQFRSGAQPPAEVGALAEAAHALSRGEPVTLPSASGAAEAPPDAPRCALQADPELLEIYAKEATGHLDDIEAFVAEAVATGARQPTEALVRALHTLKGSSRIAGATEVAAAAEALEKYGKALQTVHRPVPDDGLDLLAACARLGRDILRHLADPRQPFPSAADLSERAQELYGSVRHLESDEFGLADDDYHAGDLYPDTFEAGKRPGIAEPTPGVEPNATETANAEPGPDGVLPDGAFGWDSGAEPSPAPDALGEDGELELSPAEPSAALDNAESGDASGPEPVGGAGAEQDRELLELFLEEGREILDNSERILQAWTENPGDSSLVQALQRDLHTLKGSARMAEATAVADLGHALESAFEGIADGVMRATPELVGVVQEAHDRLSAMLDQLVRRESVAGAADLVERIAALGREALLRETMEADDAGTTGFGAALAGELDDFGAVLKAWQSEPTSVERHRRLTAVAATIERLGREHSAKHLADIAAVTGMLLAEVHDGHVLISDELFGLLHLIRERLALLSEQLRQEQPLGEVQDLIDSIKELIARHSAGREREEREQAERGRRRSHRMQHEMVRVRRDLLDGLVNYAGEVSIYRSRVEQQLNASGGTLDELHQTVDRLREQLRQFDIEHEAQIASRYQESNPQYEEFDPLEFDRFTNMQQLSRAMMESLSDIRSLEEILGEVGRESETLLQQQARVNTELQETLMQTRMVQLVENAPRLRRIVRQTSAELGRRANLTFSGAEVEMDRRVVERLLAPLEHMLRNAIAHGIEPPEERAALGKPEEGSITIAMARESAEVVLRVSDDGRGVDVDAVRRKAIERGLMRPEAELDAHEVMQFILAAGFSTAASVTQVAGRGVGMDVVSSEIRQLGGSLSIDSEAGRGALFTIRLPLSLSVSRALVVQVGEETFAIPLLSIQGIERVEHEELKRLQADDRPRFQWLGEDYDLLNLRQVVGVAEAAVPVEEAKQPLLLAQSGEHRVALMVDRIEGSREVVVKSVGPQLSALQTLAGATILADGSVCLVLELPALIRRGIAHHQPAGGAAATVGGRAGTRGATVMIVDDSITVRAVTKRLLKRHDINAVAAKDGVDALALLEEAIPDLILLDIEMPRMDGFELATHIRNSAELRHIPIIMITSRTGDKHRRRAADIGVNAYMGKPYSEGDLMENIETLLGKKK